MELSSLDRDGYVLLRGALPTTIAEHALRQLPLYVTGTYDIQEPGRIPEPTTAFVNDIEAVANAVGQLGEHKQLQSVLDQLFGCRGKVQLMTAPSCQLVRIKGNSEKTRKHADFFFFRKQGLLPRTKTRNDHARCLYCYRTGGDTGGERQCFRCDQTMHTACLREHGHLTSPTNPLCLLCAEHDNQLDLYTCWMPWTKCSSLCLAPGSHRWKRGWTLPESNRSETVPPEGKVKWVTMKNVGPGDLVIFHVKTLHFGRRFQATTDVPFRISCDVRFVLQRPPEMSVATSPMQRVVGRCLEQMNKALVVHYSLQSSFYKQEAANIEFLATVLCQLTGLEVPNYNEEIKGDRVLAMAKAGLDHSKMSPPPSKLCRKWKKMDWSKATFDLVEAWCSNDLEPVGEWVADCLHIFRTDFEARCGRNQDMMYFLTHVVLCLYDYGCSRDRKAVWVMAPSTKQWLYERMATLTKDLELQLEQLSCLFLLAGDSDVKDDRQVLKLVVKPAIPILLNDLSRLKARRGRTPAHLDYHAHFLLGLFAALSTEME